MLLSQLPTDVLLRIIHHVFATGNRVLPELKRLYIPLSMWQSGPPYINFSPVDVQMEVICPGSPHGSLSDLDECT